MAKVFLGLGSNLGDRLQYLKSATKLLTKLKQTRITKHSSIYETEPVGIQNLPFFLNMVLELQSELSPDYILKMAKKIEHDMGRDISKRMQAREIDIDILYYNSDVIQTEELIIPHPKIVERRFVLIPLQEIAPDFLDPKYNISINQLLAHCKDKSKVQRYTSSFIIN